MRPLLAPAPAGKPAAARPARFSVIIAAFQVADCIGEAIESALGQTTAPYEVIVCDDGSTDDLEGALAPYRDEIVLIRKDNGGEASAKNAGARAASGDFVAILDADDVYLPDRLAALGEAAAARPDLDILTTDAYLELAGQRLRTVYGSDWTFDVDDQRRAILERNFVLGLAAVRREALLAIGGFDESIRWTTDWDCWARMILGGSRAGCVAEPLALYRVRQSSLSARRADLVRGRLQTLTNAAAHPSLGEAERAVVAASIEREQSELELLEAHAMLAEGGAGVRRRLLRLALGSNHPSGTRLKAAAAAVAPRAAARLIRRRERATWVGAGGTRVSSADGGVRPRP